MSVRRFAAALCFALALAGCSGDPQPRVEPTPTSSTLTGDPSPTESATAGSSEGPETAEQFIERWVALYMDLQATGSSRAFEQVSMGCQACLDTVERYADIYAAGGVIRGGAMTITKLERLGQSDADETWIGTFAIAPTRFRETSESDWQRLKGGEVAFRFLLARRQDMYNVSELFQESV